MFNLFRKFKKENQELDERLKEQEGKVVDAIKLRRLELELAIQELKEARKSNHV